MAYVSNIDTVPNIIRRAARIMDERGVEQQKETGGRLQDYYDAFNTFMRSLGNTRDWLFLRHRGAFATKAEQRAYDMRLAASGTITIDGTPILESTIVLGSAEGSYAFSAAGASGGVQAAIDDLISQMNADDTVYALQTSSDTITMYWAGDSGNGKAITYTDPTLSGPTTFSLTMPDFSKLVSIRNYGGPPLNRVNPLNMFASAITEVNGQPLGYAMTGGEATMEVYSGGYGVPDEEYLIQLMYQGMPSAVLPDGTGQIDFPVQFHDIFPRAIAMILKMDEYDESVVLGDSYIQRRLSELESWTADDTPIETFTRDYDLPRYVLDVRV